MKYEIKRFSEGSPTSQNYVPKETKAAEWLNKMAKSGYRCAAITACPKYMNPPEGELTFISSELIVVAEKA